MNIGIELTIKMEMLRRMLRGFDRVGIAFSGGVDSTFLLAFASEELGDRVLALTVKSPAFPDAETKEAIDFCQTRHIKQVVADFTIDEMGGFSENPPHRCYLCKKSIFERLLVLCRENKIAVLADGTNADDPGDDRPGMQALTELGIKSPLRDVGLTKAEIREALRQMGLEVWQKPAYACLATRVPHGEPITKEKLQSIQAVEEALHRLGFLQVRVRHHGSVARIEVLPQERRRFLEEDLMDQVNQIVLRHGFRFAALDLAGYRMGSMNERRGADG